MKHFRLFIFRFFFFSLLCVRHGKANRANICAPQITMPRLLWQRACVCVFIIFMWCIYITCYKIDNLNHNSYWIRWKTGKSPPESMGIIGLCCVIKEELKCFSADKMSIPLWETRAFVGALKFGLSQTTCS